MIAKLIYSSIFAKLNRGVEQLVARRAHNPKVVSSSLAPATQKGNQKWLLFFGLRHSRSAAFQRAFQVCLPVVLPSFRAKLDTVRDQT